MSDEDEFVYLSISYRKISKIKAAELIRLAKETGGTIGLTINYDEAME